MSDVSVSVFELGPELQAIPINVSIVRITAQTTLSSQHRQMRSKVGMLFSFGVSRYATKYCRQIRKGQRKLIIKIS